MFWSVLMPWTFSVTHFHLQNPSSSLVTLCKVSPHSRDRKSPWKVTPLALKTLVAWQSLCQSNGVPGETLQSNESFLLYQAFLYRTFLTWSFMLHFQWKSQYLSVSFGSHDHSKSNCCVMNKILWLNKFNSQSELFFRKSIKKACLL